MEKNSSKIPALKDEGIQCRRGCGACCIAPSISTPMPGMPDGKPAGTRCLHLNEANECQLFGDLRRPEVCRKFQPDPEICGSCREEALRILTDLETATHAPPCSS